MVLIYHIFIWKTITYLHQKVNTMAAFALGMHGVIVLTQFSPIILVLSQ